jgi:hypothetical protein
MRLKHGLLDVNLKICTKAQRSAALQFEIDNGITLDKAIGSTTGFGEYLVLYAYHSYVIYCKMNVIEQKYDIYEFDELITKRGVLVEDSNLEQVYEELTNSIISSIKDALPDDKKKALESTEQEKVSLETLEEKTMN